MSTIRERRKAGIAAGVRLMAEGAPPSARSVRETIVQLNDPESLVGLVMSLAGYASALATQLDQATDSSSVWETLFAVHSQFTDQEG